MRGDGLLAFLSFFVQLCPPLVQLCQPRAMTGNPVIEAVERLLPNPNEQDEILQAYGVERNGFVLSTFHRPENVDDPATLRSILEALRDLDAPVLLPLHPRTQARIGEYDLSDAAGTIRIVDPIGYRDFIGLGASSLLIVSDSGGVQEEVSVLKRPSVVVRRSTERQEVEGTFVTRVVPGPDLVPTLEAALSTADDRHRELMSVPSPYGDSTSPCQIVDAIRSMVDEA